MFEKRSRYRSCEPFTAAEPGFRGVRPRAVALVEGVVEHVIEAGDRLDRLAMRYYRDQHMWWRILDANPELLDAGELSLDAWAGKVIAIPRAEEAGA
jgi:phage tail protein X